MFVVKEIVQNYLLEIVDEHEGEITFKVEISKKGEHFFAELYKKDIFHLHPTAEEDTVADEVFWVVHSQILPDEIKCASKEACLSAVQKALMRHYALSDAH